MSSSTSTSTRPIRTPSSRPTLRTTTTSHSSLRPTSSSSHLNPNNNNLSSSSSSTTGTRSRHSLYGVEDRVVLDLGFRSWKIGFGGEAKPRFVIDSPIWKFGNDYYQNNHNNHNNGYQNGNYGNGDGDGDGRAMLEARLQEGLRMVFFDLLMIDPKARKVILVENPLLPNGIKEILGRILFGNLQVPSLSFPPSHLLALVASANVTGIVVDCGFLECTVVPVFCARPLTSLLRTTPLAGHRLSQRLRSLLLFFGRYVPGRGLTYVPSTTNTGGSGSGGTGSTGGGGGGGDEIKTEPIPEAALTDEIIEDIKARALFVGDKIKRKVDRNGDGDGNGEGEGEGEGGMEGLVPDDDDNDNDDGGEEEGEGEDVEMEMEMDLTGEGDGSTKRRRRKRRSKGGEGEREREREKLRINPDVSTFVQSQSSTQSRSRSHQQSQVFSPQSIITTTTTTPTTTTTNNNNNNNNNNSTTTPISTFTDEESSSPEFMHHLFSLYSSPSSPSTTTTLSYRLPHPPSLPSSSLPSLGSNPGRGSLVIPGWVRERAAEVLFERGDVDEPGIVEVLLGVLSKLPTDLRRPLASSILIVGGTAMLPGFMSRLRSELVEALEEAKPLPLKPLPPKPERVRLRREGQPGFGFGVGVGVAGAGTGGSLAGSSGSGSGSGSTRSSTPMGVTNADDYPSSDPSLDPSSSLPSSSNSWALIKRERIRQLRSQSPYASISSLASSIAILNDPSVPPPDPAPKTTTTTSHSKSNSKTSNKRAKEEEEKENLHPSNNIPLINSSSHPSHPSSSRAGRAPYFAPSLLPFLGASLAGLLKTTPEVGRDRFLAAPGGGVGGGPGVGGGEIGTVGVGGVGGTTDSGSREGLTV